MVTMVDEIFDRHYQAARGELNGALLSGFARLVKTIADTFKVLNRIEYSAPWVTRTKRVRSH
jgi:hypothetical protein